MPIIDNKYIGNEDIDYAPSDLDIKNFGRQMSGKDIDNLIDAMCASRNQNVDVQIMERVNNDRAFLNPIEQEKIEIEQDRIAVEDAVMSDIMKNNFNTDNMSIEEINRLKATAAYERYVNKNNNIDQEDIMNEIEAEIRENLGKATSNIIEENQETITEVISEEEVTFQEDDTSKEDNNIVEAEVIDTDQASSGFDAEAVIQEFENGEKETSEKRKPNMDKVTAAIAGLPMAAVAANEGETYVGDMTLEEFNDVPVTDIDISDEEAIEALGKKYTDIPEAEAIQLINVMRRYKNHEKFNVFQELPPSLKKEILNQASSVGADKATVNFFAKSFINDLINDTFFDREFTNFNKELNEAMAPMGNIVGSVMDEYSDEVYDKFTTDLLEKAKVIRENGNEQKATEIEEIAHKFDEAVKFTNIKNNILSSHINRAYKTARDNWNNIVYEYEKTIKNVKPRPRDLNECVRGLMTNGVPEDYAKTIVLYVKNEVIEKLADVSLVNHVYSYYITDALEKLNYSAKASKSYKLTMEAIDECVKAIDEVMAPLKARNSKKNRKRNKRK